MSADRSSPFDRGQRTLVWLLLGHKAGDNNQVLALAEELGWPCMEKRIAYRPWELLANLALRVTLAGMDRARSDALAPPWPDLVITSGRRNEPIARWIRRQSGGRTRIVHIGRPWAAPAVFDLVITTPQYDVPPAANVLCNDLPLHRLSAKALESAAARWTGTFAPLPRPRTAVLLGGNSGAFTFTPDKARRLGRLVDGLVRSSGGSVLLSDSARTPPGVVDAVLSELHVPVHCHRRADAGVANPYPGYLALADRFVVTADSMSMVTEASFTGKPLYLFALDEPPGWWRHRHNYRFNALAHRLAMAIGPRRMRRDVGRIVTMLKDKGRAVMLGEAYAAVNPPPMPDDRRRAALAVAALFVKPR